MSVGGLNSQSMLCTLTKIESYLVTCFIVTMIKSLNISGNKLEHGSIKLKQKDRFTLLKHFSSHGINVLGNAIVVLYFNFPFSRLFLQNWSSRF